MSTTIVHPKKIAASRLGVSLRQLGHILAAGELPVIQLGARRIGIADDDLAAFINARRGPARRRAKPASEATQAAA